MKWFFTGAIVMILALMVAAILLLLVAMESVQAQEPSRAATTVTIGQVATGPGPVEIPVSLDTDGALVRSFHILFVHGATISVTGAVPVNLPETWALRSNSPVPGELWIYAHATDGNGVAFAGPVMQLQGEVLEVGTSPIGVSYVEIRDEPNQALPATIYGGGVLPQPGDLNCSGAVDIRDVLVLLQGVVDGTGPVSC